jgi:succinoglycan biosynthesis transport protein ExoP
LADARKPSDTRSDAVDARRYMAAVRRNLWLIALIAASLTVLAVAVSLVLPKTYTSTALVAFNFGANNTDPTSQQRAIQTSQALVTSPAVLADASQQLRAAGVSATPDEIGATMTAAAEIDANLLEITSNTDQAQLAASYANAVARGFEAEESAGPFILGLNKQIATLKAAANHATPSQAAGIEAQIVLLQTQKVAQENQVSIAKLAVKPAAPSSPKVLRNALLALFAGLFFGVLIALVRDQLRPRFNNQRDLGQFLDLPVIATIPELGRRLGRRSSPQALRVEQEAYQSLSAALRLALPPTGQHVVMLTSSMHSEGKTTIATRLTKLLAGSGHRTLLISGDLRWPRADALLHVEGRSGLSDLLLEAQSGSLHLDKLRAAIVPGDGRERSSGGADVLPAGTRSGDAASLLASSALDTVMAAVRALGYTYVLVDTTPLIGIADARLIGRACDDVIVVARLERIAVGSAMDLRDELDRLGTGALGLVVIGGITDASPYYSGVKFLGASPAEPAPKIPRG